MGQNLVLFAINFLLKTVNFLHEVMFFNPAFCIWSRAFANIAVAAQSKSLNIESRGELVQNSLPVFRRVTSCK